MKKIMIFVLVIAMVFSIVSLSIAKGVGFKESKKVITANNLTEIIYQLEERITALESEVEYLRLYKDMHENNINFLLEWSDKACKQINYNSYHNKINSIAIEILLNLYKTK